MLYGFGDSFTMGCYQDGMVNKTYLDFIGEEFNQEVINKARWGMSFEDINATITKNLVNIKEGDIVIYGGTILDRIMFPVPYHQVSDYHGTGDGEYSVTGLNISSLDYFFKLYDEVERKKMGYLYTYNDYAKLMADEYDLLKGPWSRAYRRFYDDMFLHWSAYFKSINVPFYWWKFHWWDAAGDKNRGYCGHWDSEYHDLFAGSLGSYMKSNDSGCLKYWF